MFYISLPFFYQNYKFNNFFKNYTSNPDNFHKLVKRFSVEYAYGAFPWSYWNGGINAHYGEAVLANEMENLIANSENLIRIDFSNNYLKEQDFSDIHSNAILKALSNSGGVIEVSNLNVKNYISSKDPFMKFILSKSYDFINYINEPDIDLISLLSDDIDLTHNKNKIEIIIGDCSGCSVKQQLDCNLIENANVYDFSGRSIYYNCSESNEVINYYEEIIPYLTRGIRHFKLTTNSLNLQEFNHKIVTSFIKPEFVGECLVGQE